MKKIWLRFLASLALIPCASYAYDHEVGGIYAGMIRAYGNNAGVQTFKRADGGTFLAAPMIPLSCGPIRVT
jgi:hypothetical protein